MPFNFTIPTISGPMAISVEAGSSVVFVGANGGGKTRLAVHIERALGDNAHRISAHRALTLNPSVAKINERQALNGLRTGYAMAQGNVVGHRANHRWGGGEAVTLLNDFDFLMQALFADQGIKSLRTHRKVRAGDHSPAEPTKFERLVEIWDRLLPNRQLHISGDDVEVGMRGSPAQYKANEMSDGERAIFYMIGQALVAAENSVLIIDEPELHVHRSIMSKLWDELEAARQDCGFIFITHDLEFAAARVAQKFVIDDYEPTPRWTIEEVPESTGFTEELTTLILGSRRPILFVEGEENSLDAAFYRCCYPDWTVVPRGSCEDVIHSVVTMRRNQELTRVTCSGIVDADDYDVDDVRYLGELGVEVLPVSEIENIILLPTVSRAIAEGEGYVGAELDALLESLKAQIFATLNSVAAIDSVVARYCRRRIDRVLKKIDLGNAKTVAGVTTEYAHRIAALNVADIARQATERIQHAIRDGNLPLLLKNYDNKALMAVAASHLKRSRVVDFESWLTRILRNEKAPGVAAAIRNAVPSIRAR